MLKAREIKGILQSKGHEAGTRYCLETLAEQERHMMQRLMEFANYFDKMVDSMTNVTNATGFIRDEITRLKKLSGEDDDELPPNTQDLN